MTLNAKSAEETEHKEPRNRSKKELAKEFRHEAYLRAKGLIVDSKGESKTGMTWGARGDFSMAVIGLRLSAEGHEYLSAIKKPAIWEKIKNASGEVGLGAMVEAAKFVVGEGIKKAITG